MIEAIENPDPETVVFRLKFATTAFLPALSDPFAWIYKKDILEKDPHWYEKNIMGSGPFKFADYEVGQSIKGVRNPDYYMPGKPYLDGIVAIYAPKQATRVDAIRSDRAAIEFRGLPPASRDELKKQLGDRIAVQESDWNCGSVVTINHAKKPFDDVRVRRALTLAIDRWTRRRGAVENRQCPHRRQHHLPGPPAGADPGAAARGRRLLDRHREIARRGEAAVEGGRRREPRIRALKPRCRSALQICRHLAGRRMAQDRHQGHPARAAERAVDRRRAGRRFLGRIAGQLPQRRRSARRRDAVSAGIATQNYGNYKDEKADELYDQALHETDLAKQKQLMWQFAKRIMDDEAHKIMVLWWYRIVPYRSYVKGWKISPSHYVNQDLANIWLDKPEG